MFCKLCKEKIVSEGEWNQHCRSKKHIKMIELLKEKAKRNKNLAKSKKVAEVVPTPVTTPDNQLEETISSSQTTSLPADFFDNRLEGVLATGIKPKDAEKQLKEKEMKEFNEFLEEQIKKGKQEEEEVLASLEDGDNAFQLQAEAYRMLLENMNSTDEKLPEETLREIHSIIEESGGESTYSISKDEMKVIVKEKKDASKKKRKAMMQPIDDLDWRN
ncbi:hypothetical protein JH06_1386 [Blastocystis sp. subtype 4]|uniref:hypothetical protein n=1 Tax=Blastocystis sp. subtype 4 TaxID=944170 RepID=UPI0007115273|nr:hypothetical protein JH06_1386 [Blastocystis sp. subtype 4]KNB45341.1 hypothetical protein JH06_1386 [Blastocystis sp. subtype 4]|eukprot:XP_014528784.1 hypothetical protein JH06_1386 [Blastocystis sp. subtype 4]